MQKKEKQKKTSCHSSNISVLPENVPKEFYFWMFILISWLFVKIK